MSIQIYSLGIVACSVCVPKDMPKEEIEKEVNLQSPTGIRSKWKIAKESFKEGQKNGKPCDDDPNRKHYLLNC